MIQEISFFVLWSAGSQKNPGCGPARRIWPEWVYLPQAYKVIGCRQIEPPAMMWDKMAAQNQKLVRNAGEPRDRWQTPRDAVCLASMLTLIWQGRRGGLRLMMVVSVSLLLGCGLLCLYRYGPHTPAEFKRQLLWTALGLVAFCGVNLIHYRLLGEVSYLLFGLSLALLIVVLWGHFLAPDNPLIPRINWARRWIKLGPATIQPSEIAKMTYILSLAWYLRLRDNYRTLRGLFGPFALTLLPMALILKEPDLGTTLLFLPVLFSMLFVAGARIRHLALIVLLGVVMAFPFYHFIMPAYQKDRIQMLLKQSETDDIEWLRDEGYHLDQSKTYIATGGLWGQAWDPPDYLQHMAPLTHGHTDFIFSLISHQWGALGGMGLILLYVLLFLGGVEIAANQPDPYGRLVAMGITALFAAQMFVNIGMTMGLLPITGMTLPFVSYGGSSLLSSFMALGLLSNVARHRPYKTLSPNQPFEFGD